MSYTSYESQKIINRARQRALARLANAYPDEYRKLYEEEMESEGLVQVPRGPHDKGGKGPLVWKRTP